MSIVDGEMILEDLDSKNDTFVNDRRIERRALRVGDVLQLGGSQGPRFVVADPSVDVMRR